ncbi:uncharacterized protein F5147DRAFT_821504 [Suillus discolor]|uniref:C2H2-type domain-containing protein n=1 Tax=Suillus discolor TaxID=1912936 RepID=A0A9P7JNA3_9AGAM|nr:uncharacterized protein F5147DRAFT_821504 [Suillus discolor]KAG2093147.1 hypothetical protein F5147DRAFT_821504 [Suillus discolor]
MSGRVVRVKIASKTRCGKYPPSSVTTSPSSSPHLVPPNAASFYYNVNNPSFSSSSSSLLLSSVLLTWTGRLRMTFVVLGTAWWSSYVPSSAIAWWSRLEPGSDPNRTSRTRLVTTNNRGLQPAIDHILENEGKPIPDPNAAAPTNAKSIKCSECGKVFKNIALANYHAEKSGHDQFEESTEEIKPLTEEEKRQKLADLREKIAAKRSVKSQQEAEEARANEAIRRKSGKDISKLKDELKAEELVKEEKLEDARAKTAVKAQIEVDKKARAEKAAREKALRDGQCVDDSSSKSAFVQRHKWKGLQRHSSPNPYGKWRNALHDHLAE